MGITRREFIQRAGTGLATLALIPTLTRCAGGDGLPTYKYDGPLGPEDMFADGIASGDPLADAVILWTRINPGETVGEVVDVFIEIATEPLFATALAIVILQQFLTILECFGFFLVVISLYLFEKSKSNQFSNPN